MTVRTLLLMSMLSVGAVVAGAANAKVVGMACEQDKCHNMTQCVDAGGSATTGCDMVSGSSLCKTYECPMT